MSKLWCMEPDGRNCREAANPKHGVKSKEAAGKVQNWIMLNMNLPLEF